LKGIINVYAEGKTLPGPKVFEIIQMPESGKQPRRGKFPDLGSVIQNH
jgi:hypothetical protein